QRVERVQSFARAAGGARRRLLGARAAEQGRARSALGADVEIRLDALGIDPGRDLRPRLRFLGLGDGEVRAGRRGARRSAVQAASRRRATRGLGVSFAAVVFDFNGTLSDDEPVLCEIFIRLFAEHGKALSAQQYFDELVGLSDPEIVRTWLGPDHPDVDAVIADRVERYRAAVADGSTVHEHVREAVRYAAERVPIAICSGAARAEIEPVLEAAGLAPCFRAIVSSDDVVAGKPDPEGYARALARPGFEPSGPVC